MKLYEYVFHGETNSLIEKCFFIMKDVLCPFLVFLARRPDLD